MSLSEYAHSVNNSKESQSWSSKLSFSQITNNKLDYCLLVLGLLWLVIVSIIVILATTVFNQNNTSWDSKFYLGKLYMGLTYEQMYHIILLLFDMTISGICVIFLLQYFVCKAPLPSFYSYLLNKKIPGSKHTLTERLLRQKHRQERENNQLSQYESAPLIHIGNGSRNSRDNKKDKVIALKYAQIENGDNEENHTPSSRKKQRRIDNKQRILDRPKTLQRSKYGDSKCLYLCKYTFSSSWSLFNALAVGVVIYHLLHIVIVITSIGCEQTAQEAEQNKINYTFKESIIDILYHIARLTAEVLPGICLMLYWRAREVYDPNAAAIKKYERKIMAQELKDGTQDLVVNRDRDRLGSNEAPTFERMAAQFAYLDNTKTLAAVHSLFSKCSVRAWIFFATSFTLYSFLFLPYSDKQIFGDFMGKYYSQCMKRRTGTDDEGDINITWILFILQLCILRPFSGMLITYTLWLILPFGNHTSSKLLGFKHLMSPTITAIIFLFGI